MMNRLRIALEQRTGLIFFCYRWSEAPIFLVALGSSARSDCLLEIGLRGRHFCIARWPG